MTLIALSVWVRWDEREDATFGSGPEINKAITAASALYEAVEAISAEDINETSALSPPSSFGPQSGLHALGFSADTCRMRWMLLAILGAVLAAVGIVGLGLEIAHGSDIWRKGNGGVALLVIGGFCIWHGLAERERGATSKPLWPTLLWLTILLAIGVALYLLAPPLAFLYALLVGIIVRFSLVASWLDRE
jgi:hypothetical protein